MVAQTLTVRDVSSIATAELKECRGGKPTALRSGGVITLASFGRYLGH